MSVGMLLGGRYELLASLGRGGFSTVWQAHDRILGRDVAVKLVTLDTARPDARAEIAERFEREARAVAALNHQNIVMAHDYGVEGETAYLVMELIVGGSLADDLADRVARHVGPLGIGQVRTIGAQVCDGLAAAHAAGLIHRDLKPANIMVAAAGGTVKIVDFGIARVADKTRITHTGAYLGTLRYTSPEQMGAGPVDARADLYSLGCLLFELLTCRSPYTAETPLQWMAAHQYATPAPLRMYVESAPADLEVLIGQMLAKTPAGRPASAVDVRKRLERTQLEKANQPQPGPAMPAPVAASPRAPQTAQPVRSHSGGNGHQAVAGPTAGARQPSSPTAPQSPAYSSYVPPRFRPGYPVPGGGYSPPAPRWPSQYPPYAPSTPPTTLAAAARLLQLTAALTGVLLLCYVVAYHRISAEWHLAYRSVIHSSAEPALGLFVMFLGGVPQIVFALVLGGSVRRGNPVARVLAWIFVVTNLLCCFFTFASSEAFTPQHSDYSTSNRLLISAARARFGDGFPHWLTATTVAIAVIGMLALIAAATMMSLRPSVAYFRAISAMRIRR
jgi:serine/threonine protein kinase